MAIRSNYFILPHILYAAISRLRSMRFVLVRTYVCWRVLDMNEHYI